MTVLELISKEKHRNLFHSIFLVLILVFLRQILHRLECINLPCGSKEYKSLFKTTVCNFQREYPLFIKTKVKFPLWIILQSSEKHSSTENYHHNIKWWLSKTLSQTSFVLKGWRMKKTRGTKTVKGENRIWQERKAKKESLLVGGNEFSCQRISPSQSTLHIIM